MNLDDYSHIHNDVIGPSLDRKWIDQANKWGADRIPFIFVIDFEFNHPLIFRLDEIPEGIFYDFNGIKNEHPTSSFFPEQLIFKKFPISKRAYTQCFDFVLDHILRGDTFLLNLSFPTRIETNLSVKDIFTHSQASYKLLFEDKWTVFSPEPFIKIQNKEISAYPMKGTIDAAVPHAEKIILQDKKEMEEHVTIVDLIRNDLSRVAKKVRVDQFRYLDRVKTTDKTLYQVSSRISGTLPEDYHAHLGTIMQKLLPAGSISGAPKNKTLEIIQQAESLERGYYTGVAGLFDGENLDSTVLIRFIENKEGTYYFRSGGGITHQSKIDHEYKELIDKVYVPIYRDHLHPERQDTPVGFSSAAI